jgi:hypothetical protein
MTPLSDKLKRAKVNSGGFVEMPHDFGLYDLEAVRAAVLTQEGADTSEMHCGSCGCSFIGHEWEKICAACFERGDVAPAEPGAAEGAGTVLPEDVENALEYLAYGNKPYVRTIRDYIAELQPTAAAAVPAGGMR